MLMSIKTKYARRIFEGTKVFEFRKKSIGNKNCNKKIYIYSSEIEQAIIGYIIIDKILEGDINHILKVTDMQNAQDIIEYFNGTNNCYAYHIKEFYLFNEPLTLNVIKENDNNFVIPQFFRYIKENEYIYKILRNRK